MSDQSTAQSLKEIKTKLAEEEEKEMEKSVPLNQMTASAFISSVIALEDQKYVESMCALKTINRFVRQIRTR